MALNPWEIWSRLFEGHCTLIFNDQQVLRPTKAVLSFATSRCHRRSVVSQKKGILSCAGTEQTPQGFFPSMSVTPSLAPVNPLTPNDPYRGRTAPLTSKCCILYIYSTNTGTEYFKHGIYSPFFSLQNAVCFIILTYLVPVLFTFCIQDVLKFKKKIISRGCN